MSYTNQWTLPGRDNLLAMCRSAVARISSDDDCERDFAVENIGKQDVVTHPGGDASRHEDDMLKAAAADRKEQVFEKRIKEYIQKMERWLNAWQGELGTERKKLLERESNITNEIKHYRVNLQEFKEHLQDRKDGLQEDKELVLEDIERLSGHEDQLRRSNEELQDIEKELQGIEKKLQGFEQWDKKLAEWEGVLKMVRDGVPSEETFKETHLDLSSK